MPPLAKGAGRAMRGLAPRLNLALIGLRARGGRPPLPEPPLLAVMAR